MRASSTGISSQREFAAEHGVTEQSLSRWKKEKGFMDGVEEMRRERLDEELTEVYQALIDEAKAGNMDAIRFAFKLSGRYSEKTTIEHKTDDRGRKSMDDEKLAGLFADAISEETGADKDDAKKAVMRALNPTAVAEEAEAQDGGESGEADASSDDTVSDDQEDSDQEDQPDEIDELLMDDEFEPSYS